MTDVLKSPVLFGFTANLSSALGIVPMSDNYGNSTQGMKLTCSGRAPVRMSSVDMADLHEAINPSAEVAFNLRGEIPMLRGEQSPLETLCEKLHHVSPGLPPVVRKEMARGH